MADASATSLAALAGMFVVLDARAGDQRLSLAVLRPGVRVTVRLAVVALAAALATVGSLAVTATVFDAHQWGFYSAANALVAPVYGLVGVLIGPIFGQVAGVFIAFLIPFLDVGLAQSSMLRGEPSAWAQFLRQPRPHRRCGHRQLRRNQVAA